MKRTQLIKMIERMGCEFIRHGGRHDWYQNPNTKMSQPVARHTDIPDSLEKHIIKMLRD